MTKRNHHRQLPEALTEDQLEAVAGGVYALQNVSSKMLLPAVKPSNPLAPRGIIIVGG